MRGPQKALPNFFVLLSILLATVLSVTAMQVLASWKLGLPVRFSREHAWRLLMPDESNLRAASPFVQVRSKCRNDAFTEEPIFFCGDSQLLLFCECEAVTDHPIYFLKAAGRAEVALNSLTEASKAGIAIFHFGISDLTLDPSGNRLLKAFREFFERLKDKKILVVLPEPVNDVQACKWFLGEVKNSALQSARERLKLLCSAYPNVRTIDITPHVVDSTGNVYPKFLVDSVHFTGEVYDLWWRLIRKELHGWVKERRK